MNYKKIHLSTCLIDLYGEYYAQHIEVGREYWYFFLSDANIVKKTGKNWNKIEISYIRSRCMFYICRDAPELQEMFCPIDCYMASRLIFAELDPRKDIPNLSEYAEKLYYFDSEHTIIKSWPNEPDVALDEKDGLAFYIIRELQSNHYPI